MTTNPKLSSGQIGSICLRRMINKLTGKRGLKAIIIKIMEECDRLELLVIPQPLHKEV
jgi:hypothetical protein